MRYGSIQDRLIARKQELDSLTSQTKGTIAESAVACRLCELGFVVWTPFTQNTKADLAISISSRILTIQVKTASYDPRDDRFRAVLATRDSKTRKHIGYGKGDFDFFIVFCPGLDDNYVIPADKAIHLKSANLLPHRSGIRFQRGPKWEQYKNAFHLLRGEE